MNAIVQPNQTLLDVCIQHLGNEEQLYDLAILNDLGFTPVLVTGQVLRLPEIMNRGKQVVREIAENGNVPATFWDDMMEGIGYWDVGYNFYIG